MFDSPILHRTIYSSHSDVRAGEAIFIDMHGNCHSRIVHSSPKLSPCIFEYVYFARPDSIMDGVSVYESRLKMGTKLAENILRQHPDHDIDVVIPIPDTSRTSALQAAYRLNRPFREGFIKNRYIARTFIMPGQATRRKSVRLKLNTIRSEFLDKNVLLVDDSIVRGTTAQEIIQMARDAGAKKVYFSSAAPPIRFPNIYGIDIPTRQELIAYNRNEEEIAKEIGCDMVIYQDLQDLQDSIQECKNYYTGRPDHHATETGTASTSTSTSSAATAPPTTFDTSCFSGTYVTGEVIGDQYFAKLHNLRNDKAKEKRKRGSLTGGEDTHGSHIVNGGSGGEVLDNLGDSPPKRPAQSNDGCESVSNDKRADVGRDAGVACETLTNQPVGVVR